MLKWLGGYGGTAAAQPVHSASTHSLSALDEPQALYDALRAMDLLMDDRISDAERALDEGGQSSFHQLAKGVISFLRASLGFEKDIMKEASDRLASAEASADRDRKRAIKEGHHNGRLPPGLEYAVCHAEAQLMSAVVGLLSESVVETMRSFYRLRTAYKALEALHATIVSLNLEEGVATPPRTAAEQDEENEKPLEMRSMRRVDTTLGRNVLETFSASGCAMCFGLLLLLLSLVPPSLARVMSIVGFRGDREKGLELLWTASAADNVHGAMATMSILQYYGNTAQFCDITPKDNKIDELRDRCQEALTRVSKRYPHSSLWKLEQARMEAVYGRVDIAVDMLSVKLNTEMRQVEALILFEKSINSMFLHRYDSVGEGFLHLTTLNKWSHGLYHYFAAICNIEQYRHYKTSDPESAARYADRAEELLEKVPKFMGGKRFMAQSLPLETFADRKIKKWQARATAKGVRLVDGAGISPIEEMIYVWNGYKRMDSENLEASLRALQYGEDTDEDTDEIATRNLLRSIVYRRQGKLSEARETLQKVIDVQKTELRTLHHDEWMVPAAYYEKAVLLWTEHGYGEVDEEIKKWLQKAASWGPYELETRIGIKIKTATDIVEKAMMEEKIG